MMFSSMSAPVLLVAVACALVITRAVRYCKGWGRAGWQCQCRTSGGESNDS
jgi:hypothetical protein